MISVFITKVWYLPQVGIIIILECIENMSKTWYNIILLLNLCKQCQAFCSLF
jgi:hypothetical protein